MLNHPQCIISHEKESQTFQSLDQNLLIIWKKILLKQQNSKSFSRIRQWAIWKKAISWGESLLQCSILLLHTAAAAEGSPPIVCNKTVENGSTNVIFPLDKSTHFLVTSFYISKRAKRPLSKTQTPTSSFKFTASPFPSSNPTSPFDQNKKARRRS